MVVNPHIKYTVRDYMNLPESETDRYELYVQAAVDTLQSPVLGELDLGLASVFEDKLFRKFGR